VQKELRISTSKSENGRSSINIEFDTDIELDDAANDIRERVARIVDALPSEADAPQILKQAAGFTTTMWLSGFFINLV
jgi:HAE1 family hydrophobic/amphiphilic exporter-1/multidrug efflux pump